MGEDVGGYYAKKESLNLDPDSDKAVDVLRSITLSHDVLNDARSMSVAAKQQLRGIFVHEIQHYIQDVEGFAEGASLMEFTDKKLDVLRDINAGVDGHLWDGRGQRPIVTAQDIREQLAHCPDNRLSLSYYYALLQVC